MKLDVDLKLHLHVFSPTPAENNVHTNLDGLVDASGGVGVLRCCPHVVRDDPEAADNAEYPTKR